MTKKDYIYILIIGVLVALLVWFITSNQYKSSDIEIYKNNISSLTSELDSIRLKNDELLYSMNALILEKDELERYLDISKKEVKELEKKLDSKIQYIAQIEGQVYIDTLELHDTVYIDANGNMSLYFDYEDKWVTLSGHSTQTTFDDFYTVLDTLSMNVPLEVGLTDEYRIFVKSSNPYMHITDVKGAVIEPSKMRKMKQRFGFCVYAGWGAQYGVFHKTFDTGPQIGFGFYFSITDCFNYWNL